MNSWTPPTDEQLDKIETLAARPENRTYFFGRLENPEWVAKLAARGLFAEPPKPVPMEEPGHFRFPPWPEGQYLARMASMAPVEVAEVLETCHQQPKVSNPLVTRPLLEAAQALPDEQLRSLGARVVGWIGAHYAEFFAEDAAEAIARLLSVGLVSEGVRAAKKLLPVIARIEGTDEFGRGGREVRLTSTRHLSELQYERVVAIVLPSLVDNGGLEGVKVFSQLLSKALRSARAKGETLDWDGNSVVWRPAIEDHVQNFDNDVGNQLISATRDAAARFAESGAEELTAVVHLLEAGSELHQRIALHTLANARAGGDLVAEKLGDRSLFDDYRFRHEYASLLRNRYGELTSDAQQQFMSWVLAGPDLERFRQRLSASDGSTQSAEEESRYVEVWQRDRLSFVASYLTGEAAALYQRLVESHGDPDHPDFPTWISSWFGPQSPVAVDVMGEWSTAEVINYLATWIPEDESGWYGGPSVEGLGRELQTTVSRRAPEFAAIAMEFATLDPTYVRFLLRGLEAALKTDVEIPWEQPIRLLASIVDRPFEPDIEVQLTDRDPGWRWTRREVASLLRTGMSDRPNRIPFDKREQVWRVIKRLTADPNPSPDYEARYGGENMDPLTLSINTNRGAAMHAVMEYSLWCRRELEAAGESLEAGLFPEVRDVLQEHLDPDHDPSATVRSVYGRWLLRLLLIDETWVTANIGSLFPTSPDLVHLRDAVWDTYVDWCPPCDPVYEPLQGEYVNAVERLSSRHVGTTKSHGRSDAKLGEHLVVFFWRGVVPRSLVDRWFELANDEQAGRVMEVIGRALQNEKGDVPEPVQERIRELWVSRLDAIEAQPEAHQREAQAFVSTFLSKKLDQEWLIKGLEIVVPANGVTRFGGRVIGALAELASDMPSRATSLTLAILRKSGNTWDYVSWSEEVRNVLVRTRDSRDEKTIENREDIIDIYVSRGELDFRTLI